MRETKVLQEIRKMRFMEVYDRWERGYLVVPE